MSTFIWKPSTVNSWKGGPVLLTPDSGPRTPPTITGPDGKTYTGKYINTKESRHQFVFPKELVGMQNLQVNYGGQSGSIQSGSTSYEGGGLGGWAARGKGSLGGGPYGDGPTSGYEQKAGGGDKFAPGQAGELGYYPAYLGDEFPSPITTKYKNIKTPQYKFTDPFDFASKFGELNRQEIGKNYEQSKNMGLDALNTELKGLQGFAPAAAALQRGLTSEDNVFNQQQRTNQIEGTLPGVRGQLNAQGARAETYAGGNLPSSIDDRAYEVSARSKAADLASAGGFGAGSSAARKTSDLMSAEQRLNLSKYGDQLLGQNIGAKASLLLAPTEYANAGSQIKVTPSVDAASRGSQFLSEINQGTLLSPGAAFQGNIQQNQFITSLESNTRQFNAANQLQNSQFNAKNQNDFALAKFGYDVGYAGSVAGAYQTNANTVAEIAQQNKAMDIYESNKRDTQTSNTIGAITGAITSIAGMFGGFKQTNTGSAQNSGVNSSGTTSVDAPLSPPADDFDWSGTPSPSSSPSSIDPGYTDSGGSSPSVSVPSSGGSEIAPYNPTPAPPFSLNPGSPSSESFSLGESDPVAQTFDFARAAAIPPTEAMQMRSFVQNVGTGGAPRIAIPEARAMAATSRNALNAGGVSHTPKPGYVQTGYNPTGAPVYGDQALLNNPSTRPGAETVEAIHSVLTPFPQFSNTDADNFNRIATLSDPEFIKVLDNMAAQKDAQSFTQFLNKAVKNVTKNDRKKDSKKEKKRKAA